MSEKSINGRFIVFLCICRKRNKRFSLTKKGKCFIAGTQVKTSEGNKAIEKVKSGDYVYAENPKTGEKGLKRVVQTFERESNELVHLKVNGEEITTTSEHPFYVPKKGWTDAIDLKAGDILVLVNGEMVTVEMVQHEIVESPVKVYNFEVEDFHTYYVSDSGVLVHNISSSYKNVKESGSRYANRSTNVTKKEFGNNLSKDGWSKSISKDGKTTIYQKNNAKYVLRDGARSTGGATADYYKSGSKRVTTKIRLGG